MCHHLPPPPLLPPPHRVGGKAEAVKRDATAYFARDARFFIVIMAVIAPTKVESLYQQRREAARKWCTDLKLELQPSSIGVCIGNMMLLR